MIYNLYLIDANDKPMEFKISSTWPNFKIIKKEILDELYEKEQYTIKSHVKKESVQLILNYLQYKSIPEIDNSNIIDLRPLYNEFGILKNEIAKNPSFLSYLNDVQSLQQPPNSNTPNIQEIVAQNLDQYLINCGDELLKVPIQSLNIILNHSKRVLTEHNLCYNLILQHFQNYNDKNIFILLPYLDGSKIDQKNLDDAILNCNSRFGFIPKIEFNFISDLNDKFEQFQKDQKKFNDNTKDEIDNLSNHNKLLDEVQQIKKDFEEQLLQQKQIDENKLEQLENEIEILKNNSNK